jgi:hypothetical protein
MDDEHVSIYLYMFMHGVVCLLGCIIVVYTGNFVRGYKAMMGIVNYGIEEKLCVACLDLGWGRYNVVVEPYWVDFVMVSEDFLRDGTQVGVLGTLHLGNLN